MCWRNKPDPIQDSQIHSTEQAEVVIIGLGYSGSAAIRSAMEAGADVIGIEAQPEETYNLFGRDIGHINSNFLASRGVPRVEPLELFNEWMKRAGNRANPSLVMQFCTKSGAAFDWYTDMYGLEGLKDVHVAFWPEGGQRFQEAVLQGENDLNGYRFWNGTAQFPDPMGWKGSPHLPQCAYANIAKAREQGAKVYFGQKAVQLVLEDGRVDGVITVDPAGCYHRFLAGNGVLLAAGDFSGNEEMVRELCCDVDDLTPKGRRARGMGRDGSGIQMGVWAGARLESRPIPTMGGNGIVPLCMCSFGGVWLNQRGERFCNEMFGGTELTGFAGNQSGMTEYYVVFDEHMLEYELQWAVPCHGGFDANVEGLTENLVALKEYAYAGGAQPYSIKLKPPLGRQTAYYGRTARQLAVNAGLPDQVGKRLAESIEKYNRQCARGQDADFGRDPKILDPLTDMLFLQKLELNGFGPMLVTGGGLLTNEYQHVLGEDFAPIKGLYATGNCCGRRYGSQYSTPISGVSIGMAITLGREAGRAAALKK